MQWHDVTRKILEGHWGGQAKFWGGSGTPWHLPSSARGFNPTARPNAQVTMKTASQRFSTTAGFKSV